MKDKAVDRRSFLAGACCFGSGAMGLLSIGALGISASLGGCSHNSEQSDDRDPHPSASSGISEEGAGQAAQAPAGFKLDWSRAGASPVYATTDISSEGLPRVFEALGWQPEGAVGVKLHMGEEGNPYYLDPPLLRLLVERVGGTFVDSTVLYGRRSTADGYAALAREHGFTYAPVDILDRDGAIGLPVVGGQHLNTAEVGSHLSNYRSIISVAHFKGHGMAGFGGTFKNLAIGLATVSGKMSVHTSSFETGEPFVERVAEFAKGVFDEMGPRMACINVLNNLSVDCDCDENAAAPTMGDIGIMASLDPVALDQASVDQVYLSDDPGKAAVIERIESRDGEHLLEYAEELGLGSRSYELVLIDG